MDLRPISVTRLNKNKHRFVFSCIVNQPSSEFNEIFPKFCEKKPIEVNLKEDLEERADAQHQIWSHWMKYFFSQSEMVYNPELNLYHLAISKENIDRWRRQVNTDYAELSEPEKESDRKIVRKFLSD
jgi:hypothetical protein